MYDATERRKILICLTSGKNIKHMDTKCMRERERERERKRERAKGREREGTER